MSEERCKADCVTRCVPFRLSRVLIVCVSLLCINPPPAFSAEPNISLTTLESILTKVVANSERRIVALHGRSTLSLLERKVLADYRQFQQKPPSGQKGGFCPAVGYTAKNTDTSITAGAYDRSGTYYLIAVEALLKQHFAIAIWGFAKAAQMSPTCDVYLSNLAFVLNQTADYTTAIDILRYAKNVSPLDSSIYVNLAASYQMLRRYDEAIFELLVAVALEPGRPEYQQMLTRLKKIKKEDLPKTTIYGRSPEKGGGAEDLARIDSAMGLLNEQKRAAASAEPAVSQPYYRGRTGGEKHYREKRPDLVKAYDVSSLTNGEDGACAYFKKNATLLVTMGDEALAGSRYQAPPGTAIEKFVATGKNHLQQGKKMLAKGLSHSSSASGGAIKDVATLGGLEVAMLFYGMAGEIQEMCGEKREPFPELEKILKDIDKQEKEYAKNYWKDLDKETFDVPVCSFNRICVSKGSQGTVKLQVKDSWMDVEIRMHPTNLNKFGLKFSKSVSLINKSLGPLGNVGISNSIYMQCQFGRGCAGGSSFRSGGNLGKWFSAKVGKTTPLVKYSFESVVGQP